MAQMLRLRIALYRHIPTWAAEKCFQLPILFSFSLVFFRFSGQVLNFLFRHSLSLFFFFFFSWVFWAGTKFYILQYFPIFPFFPIFPPFPPFFPQLSNFIQFSHFFYFQNSLNFIHLPNSLSLCELCHGHKNYQN